MQRTQNLFERDPSPLYYENLTATESVVVNQGGTSSAKTYSIMQVLTTIAILKQNYTITVVSNTVPKLKEDSMRIMADLVNMNPNVKRFVKSFNISDRIYAFSTGSIIEFKSFENYEQAKGGKREILFINEATRINYQTFFEAQMRTYVRTYVDYNPSSRFWIHDKVLQNKVEYPSARLIRSWHVHNPYLSDDQRQRIENIQDPELWKVYARGLTGKLSGLVFYWYEVPQFPADYAELIWGIDFGYTSDPTVITKVAIMKDGSYVVEELSYTAGISPGHIYQIMQENGYRSGHPVYTDHDTEMVVQLRRVGILAIPAEKGAGSIMNGILYLKQKSIKYTAKSVNLKTELGKYKFIEANDGEPTNKPIDDYNHAIDSARMAIYSHRNRLKL